MPKMPPQTVAEVGQLVLGGIVGVDLVRPGDDFADAFRKLSRAAHALLAEKVHLALQLGDQVGLNGIERDRRQAHDPVLDEHEGDDGHQGAALERRHGVGVADETAQGFGLGGDHGDDLALGRAPEMGQREAHDPPDQGVAQAPQHALSDDATEHVDVEFEAAVDEDQGEEEAAEDQQIGNLFDLESQELPGKLSPADGFVNDCLEQVQRQVKERERQGRHRQKDDLFLLAVAEDVAENVRAH